MTTNRILGAGLLILVGWASFSRGFAQEKAVPVAVPQGAVVEVQATEAPPGAVPTPPLGPDGNPLPGQPGQPPGKPGGPGKPADGKPDASKPEAPKTVSRSTKPEVLPNAEELNVRPDENGRVRFNFQGQPWRGVLE